LSPQSSSEVLTPIEAPPIAFGKDGPWHAEGQKSAVVPPPIPSLVGTSKSHSEKEKQRPDEPSDIQPSWVRRWMAVSLQDTPSWLLSLIVHVAIILLLALIPLSGKLRESISLLAGMSEDLGKQDDLAVMDIQSFTDDPLDTADEIAQMVLPTLEAIEIQPITADLGSSVSLDVPMSLRNGLRGRSGSMKDALLKAYGGTQGTEDAVAAGLEWLARNQKSDGSWSLVGPYKDGGFSENKPAATAMALLAFMGAGNTHQSGEYRERVSKGIDYLIKLQSKDGFFAEQAAGNHRTYAQAQCSIAICELYGMTGDNAIRDVALRAVRYAQKAQSREGGWRYQPREGSDTSVTGWYVMALISARMAGLDVDSEILERIHKFLDTVQRRGRSTRADPNGEQYAYQAYGNPIPSMTAEGMLCRLYLGWSTEDTRITEGAEHLNSNPISADEGRVAYYYWYYATTTLHHIGGPAWRTWNDTMKTELPRMQIPSGKERGSWPIADDYHAANAGRLYATCMALYCLESYYRHLPLSEMAPK
jgi:hypothetical protein